MTIFVEKSWKVKSKIGNSIIPKHKVVGKVVREEPWSSDGKVCAESWGNN
jgi:hypothetical protein